MKASTLAAALAALALCGTATPSAQAADCGSVGAAHNNPAFGAPASCSQPSPSAQAKGKTGNAVTTQDGKTVYRYGDTTVAVSGSITVDTMVGNKGVPIK